MIGLCPLACKPEFADRPSHGDFKQIIMLPEFGQPGAALNCDQIITALARSFRHRIPQPPAPRGRQDRVYFFDLLTWLVSDPVNDFKGRPPRPLIFA